MLALEFLKNPAGPGIKPVYALFGDDAYLRREALEGIARAALGEEPDEPALTRFPGDQATLADVLDEVRTLPFFARRRLAVVEGADPFVTAHRRELETYVEAPSESGCLVLLVKTWAGTTKLAKLVDRVGLAVDCRAPHERELADWIVQLARARHATRLEHDAANLLVELVGPEIGLLASEVEKLATYVGATNPIRRADVARMVGAGRVETIWQLLDAATLGKAKEALADLDRLITAGEHPVGLLAAMSSSLRKIHHAGELRRRRVEAREACQEAGIPAFPNSVEKLKKQHAHLGPTRVGRLPERLLQADLDLKGASMLPPRTVLERLIIDLARPRED